MSKRNFGLDIFRAFSIWLVLLQHAGLSITWTLPLKTGAIGVEIFFVLSGFLIGGILWKDLDRDTSARMPLRFWTRRWMRILPLYYLALIFKFVFIDHSIGTNIIYYFLFLQNNIFGISFYPVSWSLVVEEWFYIFSPLFLLFLARMFHKKQLPAMLITFLVLENILRLGYVLYRQPPYDGINGNFLFRFDSLFLGVLLAYLKHTGSNIFSRLRSPLFFLLGLFIFLGYISLLHAEFGGTEINSALFPRTIGFFILSFGIALMIPYGSKLETFSGKNILSNGIYRFVTLTSLITYAIYLAHPMIFGLAFSGKLFKNYNLQVIAAIGLTYLCATLLYYFFERPVLMLRDRITRPTHPPV